eukprot:5455622-Pyramimonas_sp.AAC.2
MLSVGVTVGAQLLWSEALSRRDVAQQGGTGAHKEEHVARAEGSVRRARERQVRAEHKAHAATRRAEQVQATLATASEGGDAEETALLSFQPDEADRASCPALLSQHTALVAHLRACKRHAGEAGEGSTCTQTHAAEEQVRSTSKP